jgi:hypothetical protein
MAPQHFNDRRVVSRTTATTLDTGAIGIATKAAAWLDLSRTHETGTRGPRSRKPLRTAAL